MRQCMRSKHHTNALQLHFIKCLFCLSIFSIEGDNANANDFQCVFTTISISEKPFRIVYFFLRIFASAADWFKSENKKKWKISVDMQIN